MEIHFRTRKLKELCESEKQSDRRFGRQIARRLRQRLLEFAAAETLADIRCLPAARLHPLKGERAGQFAVDLKHPFRLIIEPCEDPLPQKPNGGLALSRVRTITVIEITDYH